MTLNTLAGNQDTRKGKTASATEFVRNYATFRCYLRRWWVFFFGLAILTFACPYCGWSLFPPLVPVSYTILPAGMCIKCKSNLRRMPS